MLVLKTRRFTALRGVRNLQYSVSVFVLPAETGQIRDYHPAAVLSQSRHSQLF